MAVNSSQALDPVCGMRVDPAGSLSSEYGGDTYHFCSPRCLERFETDPALFVIEQEGEPERAQPSAAQRQPTESVWSNAPTPMGSSAVYSIPRCS